MNDRDGDGPSLENLPDGELLRLARAGHADALPELESRHLQRAFGLTEQLAPKADRAAIVRTAADTVAQRLLSGGGPDDNYGDYLCAVVRWVVVGSPDGHLE
ncbi:hypothetical protein [Lentzea sp. E54]|uniref:hypothetical protein n=1 Tax=Lentzea xerophila TaxID=3435883 RepID=UPI003DA539BF